MHIPLSIRQSSPLATAACLILCALLPAYGRVEEGVDTLVNFNGKNGAQPQSIIHDSSGNIYGTTLTGGTFDKGTLFEILQSGKLVTMINFNGTNGAEPRGGLLLGPDGALYGSTRFGGSGGKGTVFKISSDGKFSTLVSFNGANGAQTAAASYNGGSGIHADAGLLWGSDGDIYGSTTAGGRHNKGTLFKITPTGHFTTIVAFDGANGAEPGGLTQSDDGTFYGACNKGGAGGKGLIYRLGKNGALTVLVTFTGPNGAFPVSKLVFAEDGNFYGSTHDGGKNNLGLIYKMTPDGKFTVMASFNNANGAHPDSNMVEWSNGYFYMIGLWRNLVIKSAHVQWSGANFCGTTASGGANGIGTVFRIGDDGNLVTLVSFTGTRGIDLGATPNSLVPGQDGNLYGTTIDGGYDSKGTVFRLQLQLWLLPVAGSSTGVDAGTINFFKPTVVSP